MIEVHESQSKIDCFPRPTYVSVGKPTYGSLNEDTVSYKVSSFLLMVQANVSGNLILPFST